MYIYNIYIYYILYVYICMYIYMYVYIYLYRTDCIRTTNLRNMICLLYLHALYFSNIYFTELIYLFTYLFGRRMQWK